MKMQQLEYFVTVSQCGSLGKAAEKLFTSQPVSYTHLDVYKRQV